MELQGKVAVVTGASMGIGAALAEALAAAGCDVVLAARSVDKIDRLAARLRADYGRRVLAVPTDMTDSHSVQAMIERTERILGGVDILINNAGLGASGAVAAMPEETLRYIFDVNVFGVVRGMQAAIPAMRRRGGGAIVNVGSVVSLIALPQLGPNGASSTYAASKFAMRAYSLGARAELAGENIRVITVYPGLTRSEFSRNVRRPSGLGTPDRKQAQPSAAETPNQPGGLFDRLRRGLTVPAQKVADRTMIAIRRNEREVFISWWDRLAVGLIARYPGAFDWAMQQAVPRLSGVEQPAQVQKTLILVPKSDSGKEWMAAGIVGSLLLLGMWLGRQKRRSS